MDRSRRNFLKFLAVGGSTLLGCEQQNPEWIIKDSKPQIGKPSVNPRWRISYKLEDLCDTEIDWKDIKVYVYVEPSELLWEFHKYKDGMFHYVSKFFKENKISCRIVYSDKPFEGFDKNEFGIEILDSKKEKEDRYWQLSMGIKEIPKENPLTLDKTSSAVPRAQVVLTYGVPQSRIGKSQEEINKMLTELYEKDKEFILRDWAAHFSHEILHCMSLFHPKSLPGLIEKTDTPNIMLSDTYLIIPKSTREHILGYCLTPLQQRLIHSFIAGNNNYKAFVDSQRELDIYLENLASGNSLGFFSHSSLDFISSLTSNLNTL